MSLRKTAWAPGVFEQFLMKWVYPRVRCRVLADNRRYPYHYTRVQHLLPEDYPIRREFCLWLINQSDADPHFLSRILFSDELLFCREGCSSYHNLHIWAEENPRELFPRGFQHRTGLFGDRLASIRKCGGSFHLLKFRISRSRLDRLNSPQD
jgi:hypothetical protein